MTPYDAPDPRPGTVAEEAALLVDLLSQRGWGGGSSRMPSAAHHGHAASSGGEADEDARSTDGPTSPNGSADPDAPHDPTGSTGSTGARSECTCGGTTPAACRVCPVCQLIAFVQQVNPDTIDRVADFVGFAATALRDLATAQRERRPEPGAADADTRTDSRPEASTESDRTRPGDSA
ncbi:hypothetical protein [Terrabacter sp. C0L_2]|uniref:hypothetical protein n=1 Tax=Terrabacter sp. C0L_2 TaxID=3108389 RepID=UPI002ED5D223|nr:hypothetical protein U5C87_16560 [Terrabacter sp. C0L_2]